MFTRAMVQYHHYETIGRHDRPSDETTEIAVIVPARNEAHTIESCVESLLSQDYPPQQVTIIVVDDNSTDDTANRVRRLAEATRRRDEFQRQSTCSASPRLRLLSAPPLPAGWTGKAHACWQGGRAVHSPWLCFMDADTTAQPALLRSALAEARQRRLDMLSLEPFQVLGTFWERLLIPCGFFLAAFTQDLRRINDPASPEAAANGQFLLIRRAVYRSVGGHRAVRDDLAEDTALARRVKRSGHRLALLGAESLVATRMYTGLRPLWEGVAKNLVVMAGGVPNTLLAAGAALALATAAVGLPLWTIARLTTAANRPVRAAAAMSAAGSLALAATHVGTARHFRIPAAYGLLFPVGYAAGAVLAIYSAWKRLTGDISWKGRAYSPR